MAPNRKNVASLELPIAEESWQNLVQSKFLPLTDPREQQQHEQLQQKHQDFVTDSASYWDWPADTQEEEKIDALFSTARIEANLIHDGKKYESSNGTQVVAHDDYWAENSHALADDDDDVRSTKPQHESDAYWLWPANRNLHKEQHAERLTSTSHIESNLGAFQIPPQSSSSSTKQQHDIYWKWSAEPSRQQRKQHLQQSSQSADYWTWNTFTKEEETQQLIQSILQYEKARHLLTADHIEKQLVAAAASAEKKKSAVAAASPPVPSGGYWDW